MPKNRKKPTPQKANAEWFSDGVRVRVNGVWCWVEATAPTVYEVDCDIRTQIAKYNVAQRPAQKRVFG